MCIGRLGSGAYSAYTVEVVSRAVRDESLRSPVPPHLRLRFFPKCVCKYIGSASTCSTNSVSLSFHQGIGTTVGEEEGLTRAVPRPLFVLLAASTLGRDTMSRYGPMAEYLGAPRVMNCNMGLRPRTGQASDTLTKAQPTKLRRATIAVCSGVGSTEARARRHMIARRPRVWHPC